MIDVIPRKPLRWEFPKPVDSKHAVIAIRQGVNKRALAVISHLKHATEHFCIEPYADGSCAITEYSTRSITSGDHEKQTEENRESESGSSSSPIK